MLDRKLYLGSMSLMMCGTVLSCVLTVLFLYDLGEASGFPPQLFAAIGLLFDITKAFIPFFLLVIWRKSKVLAILSGALCLVLILISLFASMSAFDNSLLSKKQEASSMSNDILIASLDKQIGVLEEMIETQSSVTQVSAATATKEQLLKLYLQKNAAIESNVPSAKGSDTLVAVGEYVSIAFSICLELLVLVLALWCSMSGRKLRKNVSSEESSDPVYSSVQSSNMESQSAIANVQLIVGEQEETSEFTECEVQSNNETSISHLNINPLLSDEIKIREQIISGKLKPSYRKISAKFSMGQSGIQAVLHRLLNEGYIRRTANGFERVDRVA